MNTFDSLTKDLKRLGIKLNDNVFVRISYKSLGATEGGPKTVVDAILNVIGPGGTLIATAFPERILSYKKDNKRYKDIVYKKGMTPTTGIIPIIMAQYPNACFSEHPISPYVAIGAKAKDITNAHTIDTESYTIVNLLVDSLNCKCLRVGGHVLDGTTHVAFTEGLKNTDSYQIRIAEGNYYLDSEGQRKWMEKRVSAFCYDGFQRFFYDYIYNYPGAVIAEGLIGEGKAMLTDMRTTLAVERKYISNNPIILSCNNPSCVICRTSFSYSDQSILEFASHQLKYLFKRATWKDAIVRIRTSFLNRIYGCRCQ